MNNLQKYMGGGKICKSGGMFYSRFSQFNYCAV